ncbi:MAG: methyl-accepting chemotaxis protein, partial [Lachnospiraceae bacterium]|nr:methyl-accepting chemotaxis protein [Lachnospiraceae bacterium]
CFALLPMLVTAIMVAIVAINTSRKQIVKYTHDSFIQVISEIGTSFDTIARKNGELLKGFASAPIARQMLLNPDDPENAKAIQEYTLKFFEGLEGWEGLYLADWGTKTFSHPNEAMIGVTLREGDKLTSLQEAMEKAVSNGGVYNAGVIVSPSSGQNIMSIYAPIVIDGKPMGFAGGAFYVKDIAKEISDVSTLGLDTGYVYFVDKVGTMLYHKDESRIGSPVENDAVKHLVAELAASRLPEPDVLEYKYRGETKYSGYYIGDGGHYIAVLVADEDEVLSGIRSIFITIIVICVICLIVFTIVALLSEGKISVPLIEVSKSLDQLSTGDVTARCDVKSYIKETSSILRSFNALRDALNSSMKSVHEAAGELNRSIVSVDGMTGNNVDSISQINTAVNEVAETSRSVAMNAQTMAEKASELGDSIEELNTNVENLFSASTTIKNANSEATNCMKSVYDGASESVDAMQEISNKINETNSAISNIGQAIQAIETIAAQTNLLSLNASIEAARAGDAGRGFAVVADEIRGLADSSAESAKKIKQIIENVISLSNGTVEISNRVLDVVNKEREDIEKAEEKFILLSDSVEVSIKGIDTIRRMTETLDGIKTELIHSTTDLGAISEELGASSEEVAASCQAVTQSCTDTQDSTTEMRKINDNMSEAIAFFKI